MKIKMKRCFKVTKISFLVILVMAITVGCTNKDGVYNGEYPELYTVAIHSLLGSTGFIQSERSFPSLIKVIEEDTYGRKLFIYFEDSIVSTYSLLISQKSDGEYAYFYPDYNFISVEESKWQYTATLGPPEDDFTPEEIEELKRSNEWDEEINIDKCMKVKIVQEKEKGPVEDRQLKQLYNQALGEDAYARHQYYVFFLTSDKYGRTVYLGMGKWSSNRFSVMLFQPDGSYKEQGIMELKELQNYQDELKAFKELNDWNKPLASE